MIYQKTEGKKFRNYIQKMFFFKKYYAIKK
jgi:hypothetical protein